MNADQILFAGVGVVLLLLGLPLARRRVRPNGLYGLRTPATFADEQVWYEANALCGRDTVILGAGLIVVAVCLPLVITLPSRSYKHAYTIFLVVGVVVVGVRGWSKANRILRERRRQSGEAA